MFGPKYVFETKSTRMKRLLVSFVVISFSLITLATTFIIYIPIYAKLQKGRASGALFQKSPDAIAVFTGDKGRIAYAMELHKKNPSSKFFISGVHAANSFQTIVDKQVKTLDSEAVSNAGIQADLDYKSRNTFENVRETVQFLKENPGLTRILIISSDYHIMRIKLIISHYMSGSGTQFYFDSIPTDYSEWNEFRKLLKESVKLLRTFFILKIKRDDIMTEDESN